MNPEKIKETVEQFTENLNKKKKVNELIIVEREKEIKEIVSILSRLLKNNPLLIGQPGVGKTALVEGLVQRIKQDQVPDYLRGKTVYQLDMMSLRAGAKFQGELEARLKVILNYMAQPENNAILFIDEIHMIMGDASGQAVLNIANLLKSMLSRGEIQCIGATTQEEYRQYIEKDGALTRRFSNLFVSEPSVESTVKILQGLRPYLEISHGLKIQDEALLAATVLSNRYLTSAYLPDKAIDLLDETCGRVRSELWYEPESITQGFQKLGELETKLAATPSFPPTKKNELEALILEQECKQAKEKLEELLKQDQHEKWVIQELNQVKASLVQAEKEVIFYQQKEIDLVKAGEIKYSTIPTLKKKIAELETQASCNRWRRYFINQEDIADTVAQKFNLSLKKKILVSEQEKLLWLPVVLQRRVKGQGKALRAVSDAIFRAYAGVQDPNRPLASFLFLGPTGVGKTEVALTVAEQLFDQKKNFIRLDMTEFAEPHSVSKLVGAPPGYVGFESRAQLEAVREKRNSVVLFDEIEKCHPEVINLLLQILDNGHLTLANGREVDFRQTIIILTTNLGSKLYQEIEKPEELEKALDLVLKENFSPEFLNRLDEKVFFNSLNEEVIREIIVKELKLFAKRIEQEKKIKLDYNNERIIEKIFQDNQRHFREYGARPIRRYIEQKIGTLLASGIITNLFRPGNSYLLSYEKEEIKIDNKKNKSLLPE